MSPRSASTIDSDTDSVYDGDDLWDDTSFATDLTDAFDRPGLTDVQMRVDDDEGSVYDGDSMYEDDDSDKMFEVLATMDATGCVSETAQTRRRGCVLRDSTASRLYSQ